MNINEFRLQTVQMSPSEFEQSEYGQGYGEEAYSTVDKILVYPQGFVIELLKDGRYQAPVSNECLISSSLSQLELMLYYYFDQMTGMPTLSDMALFYSVVIEECSDGENLSPLKLLKKLHEELAGI